MIADRDGTVLRVRGVSKAFGPVRALEAFDLDLRRGTVLALLGPSGCGKTTALRVVAGFERPDAGEVWIGDRLATGSGTFLPPERRKVGMVFQDWALFPHLDVWGNVTFGSPPGGEGRARDLLAQVGLQGMERRMPHELSGGQQQRVALARALAPAPEVILLDEPFSNLDAALRARVRSEVREVLRAAAATAVFVTHDQEEALAIADEVAVMDRGRVLQTGRPDAIYQEPATREVALLLGEANLLPGRARGGLAATALGSVPTPGSADGPVEIMIRPEWIRVEPDPGGPGVVGDVEFYGHDQMVQIHLPDGTHLRCRPFGPRPELRTGARVRVELAGPARPFSRVLAPGSALP